MISMHKKDIFDELLDLVAHDAIETVLPRLRNLTAGQPRDLGDALRNAPSNFPVSFSIFSRTRLPVFFLLTRKVGREHACAG